MNIMKILLFSLLMSLRNDCAFVMTYARNLTKPPCVKKFAKGIAGVSTVSYMYKNSDNIQKKIRNFKIAAFTLILTKLGLSLERKKIYDAQKIKSIIDEILTKLGLSLERKKIYDAQKIKSTIDEILTKLGLSLERKKIYDAQKIKSIIEERAKELEALQKWKEALQKRQFEAKLKNGISDYNVKKGKILAQLCRNFFVDNINKIKKVIKK